MESTAIVNNDAFLANFDSIWFFSNILSTSSPLPEVLLPLEEISPSKPIIAQQSVCCSSKVPDRKTEKQEAEIGKFRSLENMEEVKEIATKPSKQSSGAARRQVLHSTKDYKKARELVEFWLNSIELTRIEYTDFSELQLRDQTYLLDMDGVQSFSCDMPPLSDGMAMKQHLRSWAHAVACTVK